MARARQAIRHQKPVILSPSDTSAVQAARLVYLIAPALRFHPTTDALLKYLSPDMEIIRIGLAETWRRGLRVVIRQ